MATSTFIDLVSLLANFAFDLVGWFDLDAVEALDLSFFRLCFLGASEGASVGCGPSLQNSDLDCTDSAERVKNYARQKVKTMEYYREKRCNSKQKKKYYPHKRL